MTPQYFKNWIAPQTESQLSSWKPAFMKAMMALPRRSQKPISGKVIRLVPGSNVHLDGYGIRDSPSSMPRSANLHSPTNFSRPLTNDPCTPPQQPYTHPAFGSSPVIEATSQVTTKHHRRHRKRGSTKRARHGFCGMQSKNPRIQRKGIGTVVSGTSLAVILSLCM